MIQDRAYGIAPEHSWTWPDGRQVGNRVPRRRKAVIAATIVALTLAGGLGGGMIATQLDGQTTTTVTSSVAGTTTSSAQLAKAAAAVQPSVVSVTVQAGGSTAAGAGVIIGSDGTILTNNHVVASAVGGASSISVRFSSGQTATAEIVGQDADTDLAVIKAAGVSGLTPATFASSADLQVGDAVLAVGNPLGLEDSVTSGIVSALNRTVSISDEESESPVAQRATTTTLNGVIQTDAAINPGNSGGPLVDINGRVVGITTANATVSGDTGSIGVGFAIAGDQARSVAQELIDQS